MSSVDEIENAIAKLPRDEFLELRNWVQRRFEDQWDRQIDEDIDTGRLDQFGKIALAEHYTGLSTSFPPDGE